MKIPGPNGVITIMGDYRKSLECASAGSKLAQSMVIAAEKRRIHEAVAMAQAAQVSSPPESHSQMSMAFQASKETQKVSIDEANPERTVIIGTGLDKK